jgi:hypothetical protein
MRLCQDSLIDVGPIFDPLVPVIGEREAIGPLVRIVEEVRCTDEGSDFYSQGKRADSGVFELCGRLGDEVDQAAW